MCEEKKKELEIAFERIKSTDHYPGFCFQSSWISFIEQFQRMKNDCHAYFDTTEMSSAHDGSLVH